MLVEFLHVENESWADDLKEKCKRMAQLLRGGSLHAITNLLSETKMLQQCSQYAREKGSTGSLPGSGCTFPASSTAHKREVK